MQRSYLELALIAVLLGVLHVAQVLQAEQLPPQLRSEHEELISTN